jgi:WD40 repeat protein
MSLILKSSFPENHIDCIWCVKYHPTKQLFASSGSDALISIWEYSPKKFDYIKKASLEKIHTSTIRSLDWDYSGEYLSAASFDNNISVYKITNQNNDIKYITVLETNDSEIKSVSWSLSGKYLACCSRKGNIWIWEKELDEFGSEDFSCKSTFEGHKGDIKMVKFCPLGDNVLFSCGFDESIKIWEEDYTKDDFSGINTLKEHSGTIWCIEFNKKGNIFFTCSDDKSLIMWGIGNKDNDIIDYENIVKLAKINNVHLRPIYSCVISFDEKYIFTCSSDGNIGIVKIMENEGDKKYEMSLIKVVKDAHEQYSVNSLCVNKNEVISCGDDCCIKIWKFEEKE